MSLPKVNQRANQILRNNSEIDIDQALKIVNSGKPYCPRCGSFEVVMRGNVRGRQRYSCKKKECKRTFYFE